MNESKQAIVTVKQYLVRNTGISTLFGGFGMLMGFVLDAVIVAIFGVSLETDAFFAAIAFPLLVAGVMEVQLTNILIPIFSRGLIQSASEEEKRSINNFITTSLLFLVVFSSIGSVLGRVLIHSQVPGFMKDTLQLASSLLGILVWLVFTRGMTTFMRCQLLAAHNYVVSSSVKWISNISIICFFMLFPKKWGINSLAVSYILGDITALLVMAFVLRRSGIRWRFILDWRDKELWNKFSLFLYPLVGNLISMSRELVQNFLASFLAPGTLTILRYGTKIVTTLAGFLVGSITTASFTLLAEAASRSNREEITKVWMKSLKLLVFVALPIIVWLVLLSKPLVVLFYQRGNFGPEDALLTANIIALFAPYILFSRLITLTQAPFYSSLDTRTPVLGMMFGLFFHILFLIIGVKSLGIYIFPVAYVLSTLIAAIFMGNIMVRRFGPFDWNPFTRFFKVLSLPIFAAATIFLTTERVMHIIPVGKIYSSALSLFLPTLLGMAVFFGVALWTGVVDAKDLRSFLPSR